MLSFRQFITEKLLDVVEVERLEWNDTKKEYIDKKGFSDLRENPTRDECLKMEGSWAKDYDSYYLGVWLVPSQKKWYVWPRRDYAHAEASKKLRGKLPSSALPLYVWIDKGGKVKVQVSSWSHDGFAKIKDMKAAVAKVPSFVKAFPKVSEWSVE